MKSKLTMSKAKKMLKEGVVRGHKLTKKQRGYFGAVAGGKSKKRMTQREAILRRG